MIRQIAFPADSPILQKRLRRSPDQSRSSDSPPDSAFLDDSNASSTFSAIRRLLPNLDGSRSVPVSPSTSLPSSSPLVRRTAEIDLNDPLSGLDESMRTFLREQRGITKLYDWQERCLLQQMRNPQRNLIVSLPTSGGKTLLAEILILKALCRDKDALFILPFVSIVQEKIKALQSMLDSRTGFLVEEYAGPRGRIPPIRRRCNKNSVYVATIEKSQLLINSLIKSKRIDNIGVVIIDEMHMLGEGRNRGAKLEQVITTLKVAAKTTQIIGLSATLSNVDDLKMFMNADLFTSDFRPVPLTECVKLGNTIYKVQSSAQRSSFADVLQFDRKMADVKSTADSDAITDLLLEVIPNSSCLVFCPTKKNTENVAQLLTKTLPKTFLRHRQEEKRILLKQLQSELGGDADAGSSKVDPTLRRCIEFGIAYHHSGLTTDERNLLQEAFLNGTLCVICCTSTLAAGVNLPAKRVILRSPMIGKEFLSKQQYKQMVGRAGRAGLDSSGESFLIINGKQVQKVLSILHGSVENCESSLLKGDNSDIGRYLLNLVGLELVTSKSNLVDLITQTLAYIQSSNQERSEIIDNIDSILKQLIKAKLIKVQCQGEEGAGRMSLTKFGNAVMESGITTEIATEVYDHLRTSVQCLVLSSHLHLLYCIVPLDNQEEIRVDWNVLYEEFCSLENSDKKVFALLSLSEAYLLKKKTGKLAASEKDKIASRLYSALILRRLWNHESISTVADRFHILRGPVQTLSQSCSASASSLLRFVENLDDLWALKQLLPEFSKRLQHCAKPELLPLLEIQGVRQARANQLFQAGFRNVAAVANADVAALSNSIEHLHRRQAVQIIISAKMLIREKMEILAEQAEETGVTLFDLVTSLSQQLM